MKSIAVLQLIINGIMLLMNFKASPFVPSGRSHIYTFKELLPQVVIFPEDFGAKADDSNADTRAIQAAIDALPLMGGIVRFQAGTYLINVEDSIRMKDNTSLELTPRTILRALPTKNEKSAVILVDRAQNVSIEGGRIEGERLQHLGTTGEWGMGIALYSAADVSIRRISIENCWGDAIYIGARENERANQRISVDRVNLTNNRRQGISVISVDGLLIKDSRIGLTGGTAPAAGIDFEPNYDNQFLKDITISGLITFRNRGAGILIAPKSNSRHEVDISIEKHRDISSAAAVRYYPEGVKFKGNVRIIE